MSDSSLEKLRESKAKRRQMFAEEQRLEAELNATKDERKTARTDITKMREEAHEKFKNLKHSIKFLNFLFTEKKTQSNFDQYAASLDILLDRTDGFLSAAEKHRDAIQKLKDNGG